MNIAEYLYPALKRRHQTQCEKDLRRQLDEVTHERDALRKQLADSDEELEKAKIDLRVKQLEVDKLIAVCRRDLERVRSESDMHQRGKDVSGYTQ